MFVLIHESLPYTELYLVYLEFRLLFRLWDLQHVVAPNAFVAVKCTVTSIVTSQFLLLSIPGIGGSVLSIGRSGGQQMSRSPAQRHRGQSVLALTELSRGHLNQVHLHVAIV